MPKDIFEEAYIEIYKLKASDVIATSLTDDGTIEEGTGDEIDFGD